MRKMRRAAVLLAAVGATSAFAASYVNVESSHVHPIDLTPSNARLLAVNTPDALLEVFSVAADGTLSHAAAIPVGLEPVTVNARTAQEAWVVNQLSDTVSIVDLDLGVVQKTLHVGDEPTDVAFAAGRAFVAVSGADEVRVYTLANLDAAPSVVPLAGRRVRALATSRNGDDVYAVVLESGNQTSVVGVRGTFPGLEENADLDPVRLGALGLRDTLCSGPSPSYPPLPAGITRNPTLVDPPDGIPKVGLIVRWDESAAQWRDEIGQDWTSCLPYRPGDHDLFVIDSTTLAVSSVKHLGTTLFDVSVHPVTGKVYVPNTDARNFVRFEHPLGVRGHVVDNRLSIVDPASGAVTVVDLNAHVDRDSDPRSNLDERLASISQPGMAVWRNDGSAAYMTAIGSRKVFRVSGSCLGGACIFGPDRTVPQAVEVGDGPTGVALRQGSTPAGDRLYVLNRISHSIAVVAAASLELVDVVPLHDPSALSTRLGRRFLYDAIDTSAHGDASCASCHVSGHLDGLAWDLGDPGQALVPYASPLDNVRFITPFANDPTPCQPPNCAAHVGFDPQKGPMTTQTLRSLLEPLHWRGDRATFEDFNTGFVTLLGKEDVAPLGSHQPAGLAPEAMGLFAQYARELRSGPNPYRLIDDSTACGPRVLDPDCEITVHGASFAGNPTEGYILFAAGQVFNGMACTACHANPFGASGGQLGGVAPAQPTSLLAAALTNGNTMGSPHSDMRVPHLRNLYERFGPVLAAPGDPSLPETKSGFGYAHDGSVPDLLRLLSSKAFSLSAANGAREVRDLASFLFMFPTSLRPAVGRQVTLPPGPAPTGSAASEALLEQLVLLGDLLFQRDCDLVASTLSGGTSHVWRLENGVWLPDAASAPALTTAALRANATAPLTFTCVTIGSGLRLGGDRDEDAVLNADDCAPGDDLTFSAPTTVTNLRLAKTPTATSLTWDPQVLATGASLGYDVLAGGLSDVSKPGKVECAASGLSVPTFADTLPEPTPGAGRFYLIRAANPCGVGDLGSGLDALEGLDCS